MDIESILTVFLLLGIVAFVVWILCRAVHIAVKLLGNSLGGLLLYLLISYSGAGYGLELPINLFTVLISLITGVFGAIGLTAFYLFF